MNIKISYDKRERKYWDNSYLWFYVLTTIYCIYLSSLIYDFNVGNTEVQIRVILLGFVIPFALLIIGDSISKIRFKVTK